MDDVTRLARVAMVNARTAMLQAEIAMMNAENQIRIQNGHSLAYGEHEFYALMERYSDLYYNNVVSYLLHD